MRETEEKYIKNSLKAYRDIKNCVDSAKEEGREEGREELRAEVAKKLLAMGLSVEDIAEATGFSADDINSIR